MKSINIYTIAIATFVAIILAVSGYLLYTRQNSGGMRHYTNTEYGISFDYPATYKLTESKIANATGTRITIIDKSPLFGLGRSTSDPTAITIDMFKHPGVQASRKKTAAQNWIASSTFSNFAHSDMQAPGPTRIGDKLAWLYTWNGHYRGISVVTDNNSNIYMFTVTYDGEGDTEKRATFTNMMDTVHFDEASTPGQTATSSRRTPQTKSSK